jgi:hypothetical protein
MFEMVEYYWLLNSNNISVCILITDGTSIDDYKLAIQQKYNFIDEDLTSIFNDIYVSYQPKAILANTLIVVNGSLRFKGADLLTTKTILFRCSDDDIVRDNILVLQDDDVYDPLSNSKHYKKKILFSKFKHYSDTQNNTAMFYMTSVVRLNGGVNDIMLKYDYDYIALSDKDIDGIKTFAVPVKNMWRLFDVYIYTPTQRQFDCSPRFIAECKYYNKEVIYEIDYVDKGLQARINDIKRGLDIISLKDDDEIFTWV